MWPIKSLSKKAIEARVKGKNTWTLWRVLKLNPVNYTAAS